jgi:hypothetical protein
MFLNAAVGPFPQYFSSRPIGNSNEIIGSSHPKCSTKDQLVEDITSRQLLDYRLQGFGDYERNSIVEFGGSEGFLAFSPGRH